MAGHMRNVLATFGIDCVTRNLDLSTAAGEIPPIECWPELWILDDDRAAEAEAIIKKTLSPLESVKTPWHCDGCGEEVEGQFTECWNCRRSHPDFRAGQRNHMRLVKTTGRNR